MRQWLDRAGGRKLVGFVLTLSVGSALAYTGHLDATAATFLAGLYAGYAAGNTGAALAGAVRAWGESRVGVGAEIEPSSTTTGPDSATAGSSASPGDTG